MFACLAQIPCQTAPPRNYPASLAKEEPRTTSRFRHGGLVPFVIEKISEPVNVMSASRRQSSTLRLDRLALARRSRQGIHSIPAASP